MNRSCYVAVLALALTSLAPRSSAFAQTDKSGGGAETPPTTDKSTKDAGKTSKSGKRTATSKDREGSGTGEPDKAPEPAERSRTK